MIANPDLAMVPIHAAAIMHRGMEEGWFSGKSLAMRLPAHGIATRAQFHDARCIINGVDKAGLIAGYALQFQQALIASAWS